MYVCLFVCLFVCLLLILYCRQQSLAAEAGWMCNQGTHSTYPVLGVGAAFGRKQLLQTDEIFHHSESDIKTGTTLHAMYRSSYRMSGM